MKPVMVILAVMLCAAPLTAQAQQTAPSRESASIDPARRALALRVVKAGTPEPVFRTIVTQLTVAMSGQALQARGVPADAAEAMTKIVVSELATVDLAPLYDLIAESYAQRFTTTELTDIETFYRSTTGQKLIAAQPELAQLGMKAGQIWGATVIGPRVATRLLELMRERNLTP